MATTNETIQFLRVSALPEALVPNSVYLVAGTADAPTLDITVVGKTADVFYTTNGVGNVEAEIDAAITAAFQTKTITGAQVVGAVAEATAAATAGKLAAPVKINDVEFDGSADITVSAEDTATPRVKQVDYDGLFDTNGVIKPSKLPAQLDNFETFPTFADFPATGNTDVLYVDEATNDLWRWSNTAGEAGTGAYIAIPKSAGEATKLAHAVDIGLTGGATGKVSFDGSESVNIDVTIANVPAAAVVGQVAEAATADKLKTAQSISITGAIQAAAVQFDGSGAVVLETTMTGGAADGTYVKVTTANGIVTAGETKLAVEDLPDAIPGEMISTPVAAAKGVFIETAEW